MTATIAAEMGEVAQGSTHYHALFGIGIILFVLTFAINLAAASAIFQKAAAGRAALMNRYLVQRLGFALLALATLVVVVPILLVIGTIVVRGIGAVNWEFLTAMPRDGMKAGGIFPAIVGTLLLTAGHGAGGHPRGRGRRHLSVRVRPRHAG